MYFLAVNIGDLNMGNGQKVSQVFPNISSILSVFLRNAPTIAGIIFVTLLIISGILYIIGSSEQDSKTIKQAQAIMGSAVIGFLIIMVSYLLIQIIEVVTGFSILNPTL